MARGDVNGGEGSPIPYRRQRRLKDKLVLDPFLPFQVHPLNPVVLLGKKGRKCPVEGRMALVGKEGLEA